MAAAPRAQCWSTRRGRETREPPVWIYGGHQQCGKPFSAKQQSGERSQQPVFQSALGMRRKPGSLLRSLWRLMLALDKLDCGRNKGKSVLQHTKRHLSWLCQVYPDGEPGSLTAAFLTITFRVASCCTGGPTFSLSQLHNTELIYKISEFFHSFPFWCWKMRQSPSASLFLAFIWLPWAGSSASCLVRALFFKCK